LFNMLRSMYVVLIAMIGLLSPCLASGQQRTTSVTLHSAEAGATANGTTLTTTGFTVVGLQNTLAASWDGVLNFEASSDNTNFVAIYCMNMASLVATTVSATGGEDGSWQCDVRGFRSFRARISGRTTGNTTTVSIGH
jgi:hypothetical protein